MELHGESFFMYRNGMIRRFGQPGNETKNPPIKQTRTQDITKQIEQKVN